MQKYLTMILSFSKKEFPTMIMCGRKIHTIREDKPNRWKPGRIINLAVGQRTKNYYEFGKSICRGIQEIKIKYGALDKQPVVFIDGRFFYSQYMEFEHGYSAEKKAMLSLAVNDGFETVQDFFNWFNKDFEGKIIHWTDHRY